MNKFAILTFAALAIVAWVFGESNWAFPGDDPNGQIATDEAAQPSTAGNAATVDEAATETEVELPVLPPDDEALAIFQEARRRLFEHSSIRARYREVVSFPNRNFIARGTYLAGGPLQMRLEYEVELGDLRGTLLQVCDGQVSWTRREIIPVLPSGEAPAEEEINTYTSRRDINQILREVNNQGGVEGAVLVAELGLGGLPAMMAGIERIMTFDGHETVQREGRGYIVVLGRWSDNLPAELQQVTDAGPDRVRIFLAEDSLFPERFVYLARMSDDGDRYRRILELQFLDVEFDVPVSSEAFTFVSPPGTEEHDETRHFLDLLQGGEAGDGSESVAPPMQ